MNQTESSSLGSELYERALSIATAGGSASTEYFLLFMKKDGVSALEDQWAALETARDLAAEHVEQTNRQDEQAFEVNSMISKTRWHVREQLERKKFSEKYAGYSHEQALEFDLAARTSEWRQRLEEEQKLFAMSLPELREHFQYVGDGLGLGIDPAVMETVIALVANGIPTTASCEGHADRGLPYPWVEISHRSPDRALAGEADPLRDELRELNEPVYPRLEQLLAEFYVEHNSDVRLGLEGSRLMPVLPNSSGRTDLLAPAQAEMQAFTAFLVRRAGQSGK